MAETCSCDVNWICSAPGSINVPDAVVEYKDKYTETLLKFQITVSRLS